MMVTMSKMMMTVLILSAEKQEKSISDVSSATILEIVLVISRITSPRTLEKNSLPVSNATTLAVTQIV